MKKIIYPVRRWMFKSAGRNGYWVEADTIGEALKEAKKLLKRNGEGDQVVELQRYSGDELEEELHIGRWSHPVYNDGTMK